MEIDNKFQRIRRHSLLDIVTGHIMRFMVSIVLLLSFPLFILGFTKVEHFKTSSLTVYGPGFVESNRKEISLQDRRKLSECVSFCLASGSDCSAFYLEFYTCIIGQVLKDYSPQPTDSIIPYPVYTEQGE